MKITPLAADSLGVRSMCTLVETDDVTLVIDPAAAVGPERYGLEPHEIELLELERRTRLIEDKVAEANTIVITHYHYDHHDPGMHEMHSGKRLLVKDGERMINPSQARRYKHFVNTVGGLAKEIQVADGKTYKIGNTTINFSRPVPHGATPRLGYVLQLSIEHGEEKLLFTSDVQGPCLSSQASFIVDENPTTVICDGPMTYTLAQGREDGTLKAAIRNLIGIVGLPRLEVLALDHHLLRDLEWKRRAAPVFAEGERRGVRVATMAGLRGSEDNQLEANRRKLYEGSFSPCSNTMSDSDNISPR